MSLDFEWVYYSIFNVCAVKFGIVYVVKFKCVHC